MKWLRLFCNNRLDLFLMVEVLSILEGDFL